MTTRKAKQASTSKRDPASVFAQKVVAGKIVAGPHVRAACNRHLKDLDTGHLRGLKFDADSAGADLQPMVDPQARAALEQAAQAYLSDPDRGDRATNPHAKTLQLRSRAGIAQLVEQPPCKR